MKGLVERPCDQRVCWKCCTLLEPRDPAGWSAFCAAKYIENIVPVYLTICLSRARKIGRHPAICDQKLPFGEWKNLLADSLATESCRLADRLATKLFFKADNADADWTWSRKVQDARELAVRAPLIVFASKSTPGVLVPSMRF